VTLTEVAEIVKKVREVEVVDAKTKEDVTAFILTQIILEEARKKNALLPAPLLHLVIQYGEHVLSEFLKPTCSRLSIPISLIKVRWMSSSKNGSVWE